jgi:hypothetical protein
MRDARKFVRKGAKLIIAVIRVSKPRHCRLDLQVAVRFPGNSSPLATGFSHLRTFTHINSKKTVSLPDRSKK